MTAVYGKVPVLSEITGGVEIDPLDMLLEEEFVYRVEGKRKRAEVPEEDETPRRRLAYLFRADGNKIGIKDELGVLIEPPIKRKKIFAVIRAWQLGFTHVLGTEKRKIHNVEKYIHAYWRRKVLLGKRSND